jgi:hypothetical protein
MPKAKKASPIQLMLTSPAVTPEHKLELLAGLVNNPGQENKAILVTLLETLATADAEDLHARKVSELNELIRQMHEGPLRNAVFMQFVQANGPPREIARATALGPEADLISRGEPARHALVVLDDGTLAYTVVPDEKLAAALRQGDRVILEGKGRALLQRVPEGIKVGEVVQLERWVDEPHIEVTGRNGDRFVLLAAQALMDRHKAGQAPPGTSVVINLRQAVAFDVLPPQDGLAHYRFLLKAPVPRVTVESDIGAPPRCIEELTALIRLELSNPDLRRRYQLPRCVMKLLSGVSGSGKTLAVQAIWRRMYEIVSEITGTPIEQLPPRVFHLRISQVLSMWLGESDKNLDRFFAEVEQLADEPFVAPDGTRYQLPVLAILEEIDGLARARGQEPIYDRILTTALQRLDPTREELKDRFIIYIGTTNEAQQVDRAFLRRIGGTVEQFTRLTRRGAFMAVLQKHLRGLPLCSDNGCAPAELERKFVSDLTAWLFSPNASERGVVELTCAGSTTPQVRHRRDFLTGALVDRAVQQAAREACEAEHLGLGGPGVSFELLVRAFDDQVRSLVEQLNEHNARDYTDVPDGVRVATVRRIAQPAHLPVELQRT